MFRLRTLNLNSESKLKMKISSNLKEFYPIVSTAHSVPKKQVSISFDTVDHNFNLERIEAATQRCS